MNRIGLYLQLFIYLVSILILTQLLAFGLFRYHGEMRILPFYLQYSQATAMVIREYLGASVDSNSTPAQELDEKIKFLAKTFDSKVWVTDKDGNVVSQSFEGDPPELCEKSIHNYKGIEIRKDFHKGPQIQFSVPLIGESKPKFHMAFKKKHETGDENLIIFGLGMIGVIMALLLLPIIRLIILPIKQLQHSAMQLSSGDLRHRVNVKRSDELGELGNAFNHMAGEIERMIQGSRELTANVSHELRSPLTRIRIAEELLRDRIDPNQNQATIRHLESIRQEVEDMDRLIGKILDLSRADLQPVHNYTTTMNPIPELLDLLHRSAMNFEKKKLQTSFPADQVGIQIQCSPEDFKTIVLNLIDNAASYTAENGFFGVSVEKTPGKIIFNFENTTRTLNMDMLDDIFKPFHRGKDESPGTGLGLAISKKLANRRGGDLTVSMHDNRVTFHLILLEAKVD